MNTENHLRLGDVLTRCQMGRSTLFRKIKTGTFPPAAEVRSTGRGRPVFLWDADAVARWKAETQPPHGHAA
jgi:predicted DNA-binding transcriptional regulator AlpA